MLGEFEYLLLSAAARLGEDAYGAAIRREIEGATKRRCSVGALYTTLDRLEAKGLVTNLDGRSHAAAGRPPKAHGPRDGEGCPGSKGLFQSGEPCQSWRVLGGRSRQRSVMMRFGWWFLSFLARALEPPERDAVLGDLAESGEGVGPAMRDLLGLIVRRQVGLWLSWRPWLGPVRRLLSGRAFVESNRVPPQRRPLQIRSALRDQLDGSSGSGVLAMPGGCR